MPWYLYHALKQLFPSGRFFSFFTFMSIVGVMLGVCVLIIVQSVMNGFGESIRTKISESYGDVRITTYGLLHDWEEMMELLREQPEVDRAAPYTEGVVMLQHENRPQFPGIRGIDPIEEEVIPLSQFITWGDLDEFDDEGVFLGRGLAQALHASVGDTVEVFTPLMLEALKEEEVLLPREFRVIGLYQTSSPTVDGNTMVCTLRVMQELYGLEDAVHGVVLKLQRGIDADVFAQRLRDEVIGSDYYVQTWRSSNREFLSVIEQEKLVISFIIIFIILVASFSIAIALMMAVLRKTREIGLLVAMGARPRQVAYSFCFQGLVIGVIGNTLGILMALLMLYYRSPILSAYTKLTGTDIGFLGVYDAYQIPVYYMTSDFVVVTSFAIVISTLAGLLPAFRAARLKPADALRSE